MKQERWPVRAALCVALLALAAAAVLAAETVTRGADLWQTSTGMSYSSFKAEPIPAGFFCSASKPFTGSITFNGKPLATEPAHALGNIDTIVRRLDDAAFDVKGEAHTRIQLMALSLASVKPIETECGRYNVTASLAGEQPITDMRIVQTSDKGGFFVAPLKLNVRLAFTPVDGKGEVRQLTHRINLGPGSNEVWSRTRPARQVAQVRVDTDGDGIPDTVLPGPSNFAAGVAPGVALVATSSPVPIGKCPYQSCHCDPNSTDPYQSSAGCDHLHCVTVYVDCTANYYSSGSN